MTDKQLKLIYKYMLQVEGWEYADYLMYKADGLIHRVFDSNSAWEVVQEMARKGDREKFELIAYCIWVEHEEKPYELWRMNPQNFFNCFSKWLEEKENI